MKIKLAITLVLFITICNTLYASNFDIKGEVVDRSGRIDTNFESYEPSYFGFVTGHKKSEYVGDVKFKLSLKYKIIEDFPLYFGYTQKSYWDIFKDSAPFRESNYAPEFFIKKNLKFEYMPNIQLGIWRHESTGESGQGSHGWNTTYLEPTFCFNFSTKQCLADKASTGNYVFFQPRIRTFAFFGSKRRRAPDNQDILDYYGYIAAKLTYIHGKAWQLFVDGRVGSDDSKGGVEVKLDIGSHVLPFIPSDSTLKLFIQGWYGYGETLKNYNQKTDAIVIGLSAVR